MICCFFKFNKNKYIFLKKETIKFTQFLKFNIITYINKILIFKLFIFEHNQMKMNHLAFA
jgi:hypothetical protein